MTDFATVIMDPPWSERGGGVCKRGADRHYPLMHVRDIYRTIVTAEPWLHVAANAHLYMWATNNFLPQALMLMGDLSFRYVTNLAWVKGEERGAHVDLQSGLGQYFRGQHELLLFGVRGDGYAVRTDRRNIGSVVLDRRTVHSRKPRSIYDLVEARSRGPYLEMFARTARDGWTAWGNEAPTHEQETTAP